MGQVRRIGTSEAAPGSTLRGLQGERPCPAGWIPALGGRNDGGKKTVEARLVVGEAGGEDAGVAYVRLAGCNEVGDYFGHAGPEEYAFTSATSAHVDTLPAGYGPDDGKVVGGHGAQAGGL